jgi:ABC-type glutathione transport system ATPase component
VTCASRPSAPWPCSKKDWAATPMTTHAHNDVAFLPVEGGGRGGRPVSGGAQLGPALVVQHLTKRLGARVAYDDVCFEVGYGEVFGFLGPNGAGKTTVLDQIVQLANEQVEEPDERSGK